MELPKIQMVASVPPIQSAIKISGEGSARISIDVPESELAQVTKLFLYSGQTFKLTIEAWDETGQPAPRQEPRAPADAPARRMVDSIAYRMHKNGYFFNPKLWAAIESTGIYTQAMHKTFIESQQCLCCMLDPSNVLAEGFARGPLMIPGGIAAITCDGDVVMHHCRSAANAGTGIKPDDWFGLPVCDAHHKGVHSKLTTRDFNQSLVEFAASVTAARMKQAMKAHLGLDSLSAITQDDLYIFHEDIQFTPAGF